MKPFIPKRFEAIAFGLLLSCLMSFIVSFIANTMAVGMDSPGFFGVWVKSWLTAWAFAFPTVLVVAPLVRRVLRWIVIAA
jgi:Protein of unknown function (DUF2798)